MTTKQSSEFPELLLESIQLEANNPRRANSLYRQIRANNVKFYKSLFLFALIMPVCAAVIAFYSSKLVHRFQNIFVVAVLFIVGYIPPVYFWFILRQKKPSSFVRCLIAVPGCCLIGIYFMFEKAFIGLSAALYACIIYGPILVGVRIVYYTLTGTIESNTALTFIEEILFGPFALLGFLLVMVIIARLEWEDLLPLGLGFRTICAGLLVNWQSLISLLLGIALGLTIFAAGTGIFLQTNLYIALLACAITGVFLGITLAFVELDLNLSRIIRIGLIRCNIRLAAWGFARYHINQALKAEKFSWDDISPMPDTVGFYLVSCLMMVADYQRLGLKVPLHFKNILDKALIASHGIKFSREWETNIKQTRLLAEGQGMLKPIHGKHNRKAPVDRHLLVFRIQCVIAVIWGIIICLGVAVAIWRKTET